MTASSRKSPHDLQAIRAHLDTLNGQHYWRSLEELAQTEEFQEFLYREFPRGASEWLNPVSRRMFLKLMGASLALAGLTACTSLPRQQIAPYTRQPASVVPGEAQFYATAMPFNGYGYGVVVESRTGRPIKVEGNPDHPASLGATDVFGQASIWTMYDPERSRTVLNGGVPRTWDDFVQTLESTLRGLGDQQGTGLRILTETVTSPTLAAQFQRLFARFPGAVWHQYAPVNRDNALEGAQLAFGDYVSTVYNFSAADVILSLGADFLSPPVPGHLRYARDFADRRRVSESQAEMNRLYVVESVPTMTGAMADHRLPVRPFAIEHLARAVAQALGIMVSDTPPLPADQARWVDAVVNDLQANRGRSLVLAGYQQPPIVHALVHAINDALGNAGQTVLYTEPIEVNPMNQTDSLRDLADAMAAGLVEILLIVEGNPAFTTPADIPFATLLPAVPFSTHLSLYRDETSWLCTWHIPAAHYLESWSDVRAFDGTVSLVQPLIMPLYDGKTTHEFIEAIVGNDGARSYEVVRTYWRSRYVGDDFEQFWRIALAEGIVPDTEAALRSVAVQAAALQTPAAALPAEGLDIIFLPDPHIFDGSFANNGWLQELPKPITKLTWDNAALISPQTAERIGVHSQELVVLQFAENTLRAAVWVVPGLVEDTVALHLGYGRTLAGHVGTERGFNAYLLRTSEALWSGSGLLVLQTGEQYNLATTQDHHTLEGRGLIRAGTLEQFRENPDFVHAEEHESEGAELFPEYLYPQAWGMSINLNTCIGCNTCTIACQAENNIPIVGKEEVANAREMHWIRVDRYFGGSLDNPAIYHQPVPCMHCEKAPCELVCPVAATVHDEFDGLNAMIYNRCVGTRYCSNNCPYKVRRFNFLQYVNKEDLTLQMGRNPEVTVRNKGVMEKCTYCVQRIARVRIEAEKENRPIRDGEVIPACAQACPTRAIVFGDLKDSTSRVAALRASPLTYGLLTELNTQPRTTYMARLKNPNPDLELPGAATERE